MSFTTQEYYKNPNYEVTDVGNFTITPFLSSSEESYLASAQGASRFDSAQKVDFAHNLMKKADFAAINPDTLATIFDAFKFSMDEEGELLGAIFSNRSLSPCRDVLMRSKRTIHFIKEKNEEENSALLQTIDKTAGLIRMGIESIFEMPLAFASRWIVGNKDS